MPSTIKAYASLLCSLQEITYQQKIQALLVGIILI